jgi:hypothetical protein
MLAAMIPAPRVYVHAPLGVNLTPGRQAVRAQVLERVTAAGFESQEFAVSGIPAAWAWNFDRAAQVMDQCQGAVILALPKYQLDDGHAFPSEFAHYEGALALSKALPTLIVTEAGTPNAGIVFHGGGEFIHRLGADDVEDGGRGYLSSEQFMGMFDQWAGAVQERSRVFLGYCSAAQATADALIKFLHQSLGVKVLDWTTDFGAGGTIMQEASDAIRSCRAGLFLFTKDDPLEGEDTVAAPRDNVVLEAGFCIATRGSRRTVIIREQGAKMPVDLGGIIYLALKDRSDISSIQEPLRRALEKNL